MDERVTSIWLDREVFRGSMWSGRRGRAREGGWGRQHGKKRVKILREAAVDLRVCSVEDFQGLVAK